jgi:hypothetical protein
MKLIAIYAVVIAAMGVFATQTQAQSQIQTLEQVPALASELRASLPVASLSGQAKMRFLGFEVYQASLWINPGFVDSAYAESAFALDLQYLRDFKGGDIAKRSLAEMLRQAPLAAEVQSRWEAQMRALFPDVKAGDRITGVNQPGVGAAFWHNGRPLGDVRDAAFAKQFFGIWLSVQTSEPQLRQALLAKVKATR